MIVPSDTAVGKPSSTALALRQRDLYIGSFSDVHLGHPKTPTMKIIENLDRYGFPDTDETGELDLILLGGDLFDEGMMYFNDDIRLIELWMYRLLRLCERRKIVLRVLEGTPYHDRKQSRHFEKLLALQPMVIDFKYITEISVEYIESLGISMLYVPDFTSPDADKIWREVQRVMLEAGVDQVDFANIHGAFTYQMPPIAHVQEACHAMDRYLGIVRNYIFTGHIHTPSIHDRILCNGSFDRLAHGEEEAKGHWRAHLPKNGQDRFTFRINKGAKLYHTLRLVGLSLEEAYRQIEVVKDFPAGSAVRLQVEKSSALLSNLPQLKGAYPHIEWSTKTEESKDIQKNLLVDLRGQFKEISLTAENVTDILLARLKERELDERVLARATLLLENHRYGQ